MLELHAGMSKHLNIFYFWLEGLEYPHDHYALPDGVVQHSKEFKQ
jgi:hypothetical protein